MIRSLFKKWFILSLILSFYLVFFGISTPVSALEGHIDFDSSSMSYFWVWNNNAAEQWNSPTLGVPFTEGYWAINGLTFNLSLDNGINYGSYTNGKINLTLAGSGSWAVDGGNLSNVQCEVWTSAPHQLIPCTMNISKSYYQSATFDSQQNIVQWAVDYQLNFVADNKKPSYVFIRIGTNRNGDSTIIPIMNGLYSGNTVRTRPRIRNASFDYSTSDDSSSSAQLNQIIDNTSDLINGQKEIYNNITEQGDKINNSINNPEWRETERQELEQQSLDVQSQLENSEDLQSINSQTTNLISILQDFAFAVGRPVLSTCILPMDFRNYTGAGFYEVDLCRLNPPSGITNVLNVIFIFFVLGLAISAVYVIIQLYK